MTIEEFQNHVLIAIGRIDQTLSQKAREYRRNDNPFHNFDRAAQVSGKSPEEALFGMWLKHIVSVLDILDDLEADKLPTEELLSEKISDNINYLILLEGMIKREIKNQLT